MGGGHRTFFLNELDGFCRNDDLAGRVATATEGVIPAYLKGVFIGTALRLAQGGASALDARFGDEAPAQAGELRDYLRAVRDPEELAAVGKARPRSVFAASHAARRG